MLTVELENKTGIATLIPEGKLSETDFVKVADVIDPYIDAKGKLNGLIIYTEKFPGWQSFSSMIKHIKLVKEHHNKIAHVALVTDSVLADFAETMATHFISATIRKFQFNELENAKRWIEEAAR